MESPARAQSAKQLGNASSSTSSSASSSDDDLSGNQPQSMTSSPIHANEDNGEMTDPEEANATTYGPDNLPELFNGAAYNASVLLSDEERKESFKALAASTNIHIMDFFAGTGNGSSSLKNQYMAMTAFAGVEFRPTAVSTKIACEKDKTCIKLLSNLNQAHRPEHIVPDMFDLLTEECRQEMNQAKETIMTELSYRLRTLGIDMNSSDAAEIKAELGVKLMKDYCEILDDDQYWKTETKSTMPPGTCATPYGYSKQPKTKGSERDLAWYVGGTVCTDVSMMGNRMALLGDSSQTLAIFLSQVKRGRPAVVTHECTSFFSQFLFEMFLPEYQLHRISAPEDLDTTSGLKAGFQSGTWLLSPHQLAWPCFRPRLFTVLTDPEQVELQFGGVDLIHKLYRLPGLSIDHLFCAPQDELESIRRDLCQKAMKHAGTGFAKLLTGAKPVYLEKYRQIKKVKNLFAKRDTKAVMVNLGQNPLQRPIAGRLLPTLLKNSFMWKINRDEGHEPAERQMTGKEHLVAMGIPVYDFLVPPNAAAPHFHWEATNFGCKQAAGNAMHYAVVSAVHSVVLSSLRWKD